MGNFDKVALSGLFITLRDQLIIAVETSFGSIGFALLAFTIKAKPLLRQPSYRIKFITRYSGQFGHVSSRELEASQCEPSLPAHMCKASMTRIHSDERHRR